MKIMLNIFNENMLIKNVDEMKISEKMLMKICCVKCVNENVLNK